MNEPLTAKLKFLERTNVLIYVMRCRSTFTRIFFFQKKHYHLMENLTTETEQYWYTTVKNETEKPDYGVKLTGVIINLNDLL